MNIRTAERRDLSAMLDIYNYEVKNGTATFDVEPRAGAAGEAWFAAHNTGNHPLLVAEEDGKVLGYASLSPYRDFDAYLQTVELSVYVAPESRGRGIASALMEAVLRLAREDAGTHTVVSVIAGGNAASVRLHEKFGFTCSGTHCPYLKGAYATAILDLPYNAVDTKVEVDVRGRRVEAVVVATPIYNRA